MPLGICILSNSHQLTRMESSTVTIQIASDPLAADTHFHSQTNEFCHKQKTRIDRKIDSDRHRKTDRQIDRQAHTHTHSLTHSLTHTHSRTHIQRERERERERRKRGTHAERAKTDIGVAERENVATDEESTDHSRRPVVDMEGDAE